MKKIFALILTFALAAGLFAGIPHPVFVEYDAVLHGDLAFFEAYLKSDPATSLNEGSVGCGILEEYSLAMVECGNFPEWVYGDSLYIVLAYNSGEYEWTDVILDYDNIQVLTSDEVTWYEGVPFDVVTLEGVFAAGWNLWSYNLQLPSYDVADVFSMLDYLTKVKSITQSYDPSLDPQFNTLNSIDDGYGYWVQVSALDTLVFRHLPPLLLDEVMISLFTGWNLIGYVPQTPDSVAHAFEAIEGLVKVKSITKSFDPNLLPQFNTLKIVRISHGYWIDVEEAQDFQYEEPIEIEELQYRAVDAEEYFWTPIIYTNSTCAYAEINETYGQIGAFVNGECRGVTTINDGYVSLVINGAEAETATFKLNQNGQITSFDTRVTTAPGEDIFFDLTSNAPSVTQLINAYPNPFNPVTTVAYTLGEAGNVNISVYNIKGQKVTELVNEHQEAGPQSVVWKADGQASGIYFVKMTASGADQIQKVILMK